MVKAIGLIGLVSICVMMANADQENRIKAAKSQYSIMALDMVETNDVPLTEAIQSLSETGDYLFTWYELRDIVNDSLPLERLDFYYRCHIIDELVQFDVPRTIRSIRGQTHVWRSLTTTEEQYVKIPLCIYYPSGEGVIELTEYVKELLIVEMGVETYRAFAMEQDLEFKRIFNTTLN